MKNDDKEGGAELGGKKQSRGVALLRGTLEQKWHLRMSPPGGKGAASHYGGGGRS
jgi:hypothetical protein